MYLIDTNVISEARKGKKANLGVRQYLIDKQIAAIALIYGLTVVTRNLDDFRGTGVGLKNPFL